MESLSQLPMARKMGDVNEILKAAPELSKHPVEKWVNTFDFFKQQGFNQQQFGNLIVQNPKLMTTPQDKLASSINHWRSLQFGSRDTIALLERYPELMHIQESNELTQKLEIIKAYVGNGSQLYKLLMNSPDVTTQPLSSIEAKIEYLDKVMKIDIQEVYKSEAFSRDLQTIKTRHVFLERLGMFIVKKKKDPNELSKNPKLYHILDTSEKRFATKVCHVSLEEYETFEQLYKIELEGQSKFAQEDEDELDAADLKGSYKRKT